MTQYLKNLSARIALTYPLHSKISTEGELRYNERRLSINIQQIICILWSSRMGPTETPFEMMIGSILVQNTI